MSKLYVVGDSFCADRDCTTDWPLALANETGLKLTGKGYPGACWWETRRDLLEYVNSDDYQDTKCFIIVHTDFHRLLSSKINLLINPNDPVARSVRKVFLAYMQDSDIDLWIMQQWFREINQILDSKHVIHIAGFPSLYHHYDTLSGNRVRPDLLSLSLSEPGITIGEFFKDSRRNHFSTENNLKIAHTLARYVNAPLGPGNDIELLF